MAPYLGLKGRKLALVRVAMIVVPAFLLFGYNQSQTGGIINYSSFIETFPQTNTKTTKGAVKSHNANVQGQHLGQRISKNSVLILRAGTAVAIYTIGCMFGALSCPFTGNRIGRRKTLLLYAIIATLGHILQSSSYSLPQLIVGRVVSGLGVGGINAIGEPPAPTLGQELSTNCSISSLLAERMHQTKVERQKRRGTWCLPRCRPGLGCLG